MMNRNPGAFWPKVETGTNKKTTTTAQARIKPTSTDQGILSFLEPLLVFFGIIESSLDQGSLCSTDDQLKASGAGTPPNTFPSRSTPIASQYLSAGSLHP